MSYTIGQMANLLNVSTSTLRYYDKEGLLPFIERSKSGIRIFKDSDYEWLKIIECFKKNGMQLKDIRSFILMAMQGDTTIDDRLELIADQRKSVISQIDELKERLEILDFKLWYYEKAKKDGTTKGLKNMNLSDIPEQYRDVRKKLRLE